jgi:hypothetical protein
MNTKLFLHLQFRKQCIKNDQGCWKTHVSLHLLHGQNLVWQWKSSDQTGMVTIPDLLLGSLAWKDGEPRWLKMA